MPSISSKNEDNYYQGDTFDSLIKLVEHKLSIYNFKTGFKDKKPFLRLFNILIGSYTSNRNIKANNTEYFHEFPIFLVNFINNPFSLLTNNALEYFESNSTIEIDHILIDPKYKEKRPNLIDIFMKCISMKDILMKDITQGNNSMKSESYFKFDNVKRIDIIVNNDNFKKIAFVINVTSSSICLDLNIIINIYIFKLEINHNQILEFVNNLKFLNNPTHVNKQKSNYIHNVFNIMSFFGSSYIFDPFHISNKYSHINILQNDCLLDVRLPICNPKLIYDIYTKKIRWVSTQLTDDSKYVTYKGIIQNFGLVINYIIPMLKNRLSHEIQALFRLWSIININDSLNNYESKFNLNLDKLKKNDSMTNDDKNIKLGSILINDLYSSNVINYIEYRNYGSIYKFVLYRLLYHYYISACHNINDRIPLKLLVKTKILDIMNNPYIDFDFSKGKKKLNCNTMDDLNYVELLKDAEILFDFTSN